jgi:hypothetical protein
MAFLSRSLCGMRTPVWQRLYLWSEEMRLPGFAGVSTPSVSAIGPHLCAPGIDVMRHHIYYLTAETVIQDFNGPYEHKRATNDY